MDCIFALVCGFIFPILGINPMWQKLFQNRFLVLFLVASAFAVYRFTWKKPPKDIDLRKINPTTIYPSQPELSSMKGKTIFLSFWASWCKDCRKEMPGITAAAKALEKENIAFILVSDEEKEKIQTFRESFSYSTTLFYKTNTAFRDIGVNAIPTDYILSPSGKVLYSSVESHIDWSTPENIQKLREYIAQP